MFFGEKVQNTVYKVLIYENMYDKEVSVWTSEWETDVKHFVEQRKGKKKKKKMWIFDHLKL